MPDSLQKNENPFISVIVPVYNDPSGLEDTLQSLIAQEYAGNFEIIVADNGSTDNTPDIAEKYCGDSVKLVVEDTVQSSYAARNKGLEIAKGSIIAFIDSDMTVEKDWLQKISQSMAKHNADYLGCRVEIYSESNSLSALHNKLSGFPMDEYIYKRHFAPTCCLIVRKEIFEHVGVFDPNLISSGDYEFGNRVFDAGYKLYYDSDIVMYHPARTSLKKLLKKSFRIGRGFCQFASRYPELSKEMNRNTTSSLSGSNNASWSLFTFRKESDIWTDLPVWKKAGIYAVDVLNKGMKPVGYFYEKFFS
jgi:glycosyltransferase involved in cell wall biosynthesis